MAHSRYYDDFDYMLTICEAQGHIDRIVTQHSSSANPNSASTVCGISKDTQSGMTSKL